MFAFCLGQPVSILLSTGSVSKCWVENIEEGLSRCPDGWYGSRDRDFCFKVYTEKVDNEEACRLVLKLLMNERFKFKKINFVQNVAKVVKFYKYDKQPFYFWKKQKCCISNLPLPYPVL